ncbi:MAG: hypothetical protein IMF19_16980 [Proteobacteria bacterium]|nr:hypothetical protein [Pseudomonadota bacterium]
MFDRRDMWRIGPMRGAKPRGGRSSGSREEGDRKYPFMGESQIVLKEVRKEVLSHGEDLDIRRWRE